jgi:predicted protein tyrosine phosphatase
MRILFICSGNKDRSRTAEDMFSEHFTEHVFDSAGTNQKICFQLGNQFIEEGQLSEADIVFVMETKHLKFLKSNFKSFDYKKVNVLNIPDRFSYGDSKLKEILHNSIISDLLN